MNAFLAARMGAVRPSATIAIATRAQRMRSAGIDVIGLAQGEPDFDTPAHVVEAAARAARAGQTRYTAVDGTPDLKRAIAAHIARTHGVSYDAASISVGTGAKQVIFNALLATLDAGDEVIVPAPYWVSYPDMVRLCGGEPRIVECDAEAGFKLSAQRLEAAIGPRTKWLILNSPSNPTGVAYTASELAALAAVLHRHPRVHVLSDDIYSALRYDGSAHATMAQVDDAMRARTLFVDGVSKAYCMTGWRIGWGAGPAWLIEAIATIQSQSTSNPSAIGQAAAVAALDGPTGFIAEHNAVFRERRDWIVDLLQGTPGLACARPDGAFYVFPSCRGLAGRVTPAGLPLRDDLDVAGWLLDEARVAVVPGSAFGAPGHFRISYAVASAVLQEAGRRIRDAAGRLA
jgi:aspartate aminotransferase